MKRASRGWSRRRTLILFVVILFFIPVSSCDDNGPTGTQYEKPVGSLVQATGCLLTQEAHETAPPRGMQDCIEFEYDTGGTLILRHRNAGFNCCPGTITADIEIFGHVIAITEHEEQYGCRCLCLYNLDYMVEHLQPGEYEILVKELYTVEGDKPLSFTVNFLLSPSGSFCVDRNHYPWDVSQSQEPSGTLVDMTGCKPLTRSSAEIIRENQVIADDCIEYAYLLGDTLLLKHINAGFNCCPTLYTDIHIDEGTITITEIEIESPCDCGCLFDLDYRIVNLPAGEYTVSIVEPYVRAGDEKLEFSMNLASTPAGAYCVPRDHYPWQ
jgi:hypothetical protein